MFQTTNQLCTHYPLVISQSYVWKAQTKFVDLPNLKMVIFQFAKL